MIIYILSFIVAIVVGGIGYGYFLSEKGYSGEVSDHFDGKRFLNPNGKKGNGLKEVFQLVRTRKPEKWTEGYETYVHNTPISNAASEDLNLIFVNHSSFLIQIDSLNVLTDPVWSDRCSPLQWIGPKRNRPPGIQFDCLPKIDLVLISHNHYDHLDKNTIERIQAQHAPQFIVPLGVSHFFKRLGITNVIEIDWNQEVDFRSLKITGTPAIHFSSRGIFDRDNTLWCGFMIEGSKKVYYVGDTAYDDGLFKKMGKAHQDIDVAIVPIGAYKPNWFMSLIHTNPEEAVKIHLDLNPTVSVATHFGTFRLADEGEGVAENDLLTALEQYDLSNEDFKIPDEGVFLNFK